MNDKEEKTDGDEGSEKGSGRRGFLLKFLCLCVYIAAFTAAVFIFVNCKMRYLEEHGYTRYNLTPVEMRQLDLALNITLDVIKDMAYDKDEFYATHIYDTKKRRYELQEGPDSSYLVEEFNAILFALPDGHPALVLGEEYGFSEANPMTLEWVLEHPKKTCQMIDIDEDVMYAIRRKRLERSKY